MTDAEKPDTTISDFISDLQSEFAAKHVNVHVGPARGAALIREINLLIKNHNSLVSEVETLTRAIIYKDSYSAKVENDLKAQIASLKAVIDAIPEPETQTPAPATLTLVPPMAEESHDPGTPEQGVAVV